MDENELEKRLWDAANALRGPIDPADFKTYVFPMLFWKWVSDNYDYEHAKAVAAFGDDVEPEVEADFHRFDLPAGCHWSQVTTKTANLGVQVNKALGKIEQANPETLAGIFGDAAWGNKERLPETALVNLNNAFNGITLDPSTVSNDVLGRAYEYLLKNFADESGKKAGEFFTPRPVVRLLISILDPQAGETIYDPANGSGGMLVEAIATVKANGGDTRTLRLYGQEVNLTTAAIARMNLFLHDIEDFRIIRGDTLRSPGFRDQNGRISEFDVVVANPPFSLKNWGADDWPSDPRSFCGVPPATNGDLAWVQHMVTSMAAGTGRVGVVMPHGVLFRGGAEGKIRRCLVEQDQLEAVIGLPKKLFYSTGIPASLLIFRGTKPEERRGHVLFIDGSARFMKGKNQNNLTEADVAVLLLAYRTGTDPGAGGGVRVRLVPQKEIKSNSYDLSVGRYLKTAATETIGILPALSNYDRARQVRLDCEHALAERLSLVMDSAASDDLIEEWSQTTLGKIASTTRGISYKSSELGSGEDGVPFLNLKCVERGGGFRWEGVKRFTGAVKPTQNLQPGDLLVAATDLTRDKAVLGCPMVVPDDAALEGATFSLDLVKLTVEKSVAETTFVGYLLQSRAARDFMKIHSSGTTVIHLKVKEIGQFAVPLPPLHVQRRITDLLSTIDMLVANVGGGVLQPVVGGSEYESLLILRNQMISALLSREIEIPESYDALLGVMS